MVFVNRTIEEATELVDDFVLRHRQAAIPALIGACVQWAVFHGGTEVVKGSLENAIKLADEMRAGLKKGAQ